MEDQNNKAREAFLSGPRFKFILIAAAALAVRLVYLIEFKKSPFFSYFFMDPLWHHQWAVELSQGGWVGKEVFFRAPLYPYLLGVIYTITDGALVAPRLLQFGLGAASAGLVYMIGRRVFDRELPAMAAGLAFALYGPMIYFEGELLIPGLIVFLDLLGILLFFRAQEGKGAARYAATGLVFGISAVARPNVLAPALLLAVWSGLEGFRPSLGRMVRRALPLTAALFVLPLLVTVRNGAVGGDYVFISSQSGVNFYIGNSEDADGRTSKRPGLRVSAGNEYRDSVWLTSVLVAEQEAGRKLTPSGVSRFWYGKALKWMVSEPAWALDLYGRKLFYLVHGHEIPSNNVPYYARNFSRVLSVLMWDRIIAFPAGIAVPLALIGMAAGWPERKRWAPLYVFTIGYAATILVFFVNSRYRMPLVGPMLLFAALGAIAIFSSAARREWKRLAPAVAGLAALVCVSNINALEVRDDDLALPLLNMGNYYYDQGRADEAIRYYRETLKFDPDNHLAVGNLGTIAFQAGDYAAAERMYRRALKGNPENPMIHLNIGLALEQQGDLQGAEKAFLEALKLAPDYRKAELNLQRIRADIKNRELESAP
jgi:tetratricopeptide (TPR) repeat protein